MSLLLAYIIGGAVAIALIEVLASVWYEWHQRLEDDD